MTNLSEIISYCQSLAGSAEAPHFEKTSFRINKKIFVTIDKKLQRLCLKFTENDQSIFCAMRPEQIYAVPNKWGKQGWTLVNFPDLPMEILSELIECAYKTVAKK